MQRARTPHACAADGAHREILDALALFQQALELAEPVAATMSLMSQKEIVNLAGNALERLDDAASHALYQRGIGAFDHAWGP